MVRDAVGDLVFTFYKEFGQVDVLIAEALCLQAGLKLCLAQSMGHLTVEVDAKSLVQLVNSNVLAKWPLCRIIQNIWMLIKEMHATLNFIYWEGSLVAVALVSVRLGLGVVFTEFYQLPPTARASCQFDKGSLPHFRRSLTKV